MEENQQSALVDNMDTNEAGSASAEAITSLVAERDELAQAKADLHDRFLRLQAEFENFRRRSERERMEFAEYAGEQTIRSLLPVLDDLERAVKAATEAASDSEIAKGVELVHGRMMEILKRQGLEPIDAEGAKFDPHQHEAIGRSESQDHEDGTILQVYQRGYNFKGRLLRPAMVQVAVHP